MKPAVALDALAQPGGRGRGVAARERLVEVGEVAPQRRVEAAGVDVAQAVGREVAEEPHRPVDVLKAAVRGAVHLEPEVAREPLVPGVGQVGRLQVAGDHRALQVEAHQDVEVVVHLVGLGADVAGRDAVDRGVEAVGPRDGEVAEDLAHPPVEPAHEGARAAELVLVEPRLALVDPHRDALADRREVMGRVNPLLVGGVARLVDGGVEAVHRVAWVGAGRDPHVEARP